MSTEASQSPCSQARKPFTDILNQALPSNKRFKPSANDDFSESAGQASISSTPTAKPLVSSSLAQIPSAATVSVPQSSPEEPMYWRQLFQNLQKQRVTQAEQLLHEFMAASEKRERTLKTYIQGLEEDLGRAQQTIETNSKQVHTSVQLQHELDQTKQEVEILRKQLQEAKSTIAQKSGILQGVNHQLQTQQNETSELQDQLENMKLKLESVRRTSCFAQLMMGSNLREIEADGPDKRSAYDCTMRNDETNVSTTFRLTDHIKHMNYTPLRNPDPLPEFLHGSIDFDHNQLPALVQNGLRSIFPEDD